MVSIARYPLNNDSCIPVNSHMTVADVPVHPSVHQRFLLASTFFSSSLNKASLAHHL